MEGGIDSTRRAFVLLFDQRWGENKVERPLVAESCIMKGELEQCGEQTMGGDEAEYLSRR